MFWVSWIASAQSQCPKLSKAQLPWQKAIGPFGEGWEKSEQYIFLVGFLGLSSRSSEFINWLKSGKC